METVTSDEPSPRLQGSAPIRVTAVLSLLCGSRTGKSLLLFAQQYHDGVLRFFYCPLKLSRSTQWHWWQALVAGSSGHRQVINDGESCVSCRQKRFMATASASGPGRRKNSSQKWFHPGSNWGSFACEANGLTNFPMEPRDSDTSLRIFFSIQLGFAESRRGFISYLRATSLNDFSCSLLVVPLQVYCERVIY